MPFYTFETETGEEITIEMSMTEREEYIKNNPKHKQLITNMARIYDTGGIKTDNGWRDMLGRIKKANRGSTITVPNIGEY